MVYHLLNRANARMQIFDNEKNYDAFERILDEAAERVRMRLLAYCVMPNHWHLVVRPRENGGVKGVAFNPAQLKKTEVQNSPG